MASPEVSWRWTSSAHDAVSLGERVSGEVLALDTELRGQAVLSLCALRENPWAAWAARVGNVVTGCVAGNFVPLGVFVTLEEGVAGLLPYTALGPVGHQETVPLGQETTVRIASVDVSRRQIHLALPERDHH